MPKLFACLYYQKKSMFRTLGMRKVLKKLENLTASAPGP